MKIEGTAKSSKLGKLVAYDFDVRQNWNISESKATGSSIEPD